MAGLGALFWEGRGWWVGRGCSGLATRPRQNKSAENISLDFSISRHELLSNLSVLQRFRLRSACVLKHCVLRRVF